MENGLIYIIFNFIIEKFKYLNLVELFNYIAQLINPQKTNPTYIDIYRRNVIDIFITLKWSFVVSIFCFSCNSNFLTLIVWYLLITNVYTYFYYHIWDDEAINKDDHKIAKVRRQFILLLSSISFSNICFAYLYRIPYCADYTWSSAKPDFIKSIWFSISNSLAANYAEVCAFTDFGNNVAMIQLIITFLFVTIILGKSIPQTTSTT